MLSKSKSSKDDGSRKKSSSSKDHDKSQLLEDDSKLNPLKTSENLNISAEMLQKLSLDSPADTDNEKNRKKKMLFKKWSVADKTEIGLSERQVIVKALADLYVAIKIRSPEEINNFEHQDLVKESQQIINRGTDIMTLVNSIKTTIQQLTEIHAE